MSSPQSCAMRLSLTPRSVSALTSPQILMTNCISCLNSCLSNIYRHSWQPIKDRTEIVRSFLYLFQKLRKDVFRYCEGKFGNRTGPGIPPILIFSILPITPIPPILLDTLPILTLPIPLFSYTPYFNTKHTPYSNTPDIPPILTNSLFPYSLLPLF